jgi:hypothetical protein
VEGRERSAPAPAIPVAPIQQPPVPRRLWLLEQVPLPAETEYSLETWKLYDHYSLSSSLENVQFGDSKSV